MTNKKRCPKCGHDAFFVNPHVVQSWMVDADGGFIGVINDCVEVTHEPNDNDIWECTKCGYEAEGEVFNIGGRVMSATDIIRQLQARISLYGDWNVVLKCDGEETEFNATCVYTDEDARRIIISDEVDFF